MENSNLSKCTVSFGLSVAVCAVWNALLVIAKEKNQAVATWMRKVTGHHWVTHVALVLIAFAIFGGLFSRLNGDQGPKMPANRLTNIILGGVIASVFIIMGFYILAD
jgi:hypothetical protein